MSRIVAFCDKFEWRKSYCRRARTRFMTHYGFNCMEMWHRKPKIF